MRQSGSRPAPSTRGETWNTPERIAVHRRLSHSERLRLTIEASRATLRFADGERVDEPRADFRAARLQLNGGRAGY